MRKESCPDEETMACFVEGLLKQGEKGYLERHFAGCENCREIIEVTRMVWFNEKNGEVLEMPKELLDWARGAGKYKNVCVTM